MPGPSTVRGAHQGGRALGLEIRLLGRFQVRRDGEEIPAGAFGGRLVRKLLRVLLIRRGEFVSKDELAEALWGERLPADPAANLEVLVSRARRALGEASLIETGPGGYTFVADARCRVDAQEVLRLAEEGQGHLSAGRHGAALRAFRTVVEAWGGEPLAEDLYEDWSRAFRLRLARAQLEALEGGAHAALARRDPRLAVRLAERAVAREPLREAARLLLARALAASGDRPGALQALDELDRTLTEELGLEPSPAAEALREAIRDGQLVLPSRQEPVELWTVAAPEEWPFVGRERELASLMHLLSGHPPRVGLVTGPGGMGKSRLLEEALKHPPLPVLAAFAYPSGQEEPWELARSILAETLALDVAAAAQLSGPASAALRELLPELAELRPAEEVRLDPHSGDLLARQGAVHLLSAAAGPGLALVVDDLQWTDPSSLALLGEAVRRIPRLRLILAYRPEEIRPHGPVAEFLSRLRSDFRVRELELGPLKPADIRRWVPEETLSGALLEETDRSPLSILEVLRDLHERQLIERPPGKGWRLSARVGEEQVRGAARTGQQRTILARVGRLAPADQELLRLLALVERSVPARLLAGAAGRPEQRILERLDVLARIKLAEPGVQGWALSHDRVAEAIQADLQEPERARLHGVLAQALQAQGADPELVARHLAGSGDAFGAARAYAAGAQRALDRYANQEALQLAQEGLKLVGEPSEKAELLSLRSEARARTGELERARKDLRRVLTLRPRGSQRVRDLTRMAMLSAGLEDYARGGEVADLALAEAGEDEAARAGALSVAAIMDMNTGRMERAEARFQEALGLFESLEDAHGAAGILDARAMAAFMAGRIREAVQSFDRAARLFLDSGQLLRVSSPRSTRGHGLVFMDQPQPALAETEEALEVERSLGRPEGESMCLWHRSEALLALGRREEALESARASLELARQVGHREWTSAGLRAVGLCLEAGGDLEAAEGAFRESLEIANMGLFSGWAASRLALLKVRQEALEEAEAFVRQALESGIPLSHYEARLAAAALAAAREDPDAAEQARAAAALARQGGHLQSARLLEDALDELLP